VSAASAATPISSALGDANPCSIDSTYGAAAVGVAPSAYRRAFQAQRRP